jgi:hypothetical protein
VTHVLNKRANRPVEVVVLSDTRGSCAGLGVECLLLIVDPVADVGLSAVQIATLNRGEPIVDTSVPPASSPSSYATPHMMIRVRPVSTAVLGDTAAQIVSLGDAVISGLACADSIPGTRGVVIVVPDAENCELLPSLSKDLIRRTMCRKVLQFSHDQELKSLRRIVLRDDCPVSIVGGLLKSSFDDAAGSSGSAFVSAILSHLEEDSTQLLSFLEAKIVSSIVPLPTSLPQDVVEGGRGLAGKSGGRQCDVVLCMVRGQPESIQRAIKEMAALSLKE